MKKIHVILAAIFIVAACQKTENAPLKAEFESDTQEIGIGEKVTFKDISSGNPSRWNWTFEGGEPETSVLFAPEVVYNNPGTYSVKLTVQRGDQTSEIVKEDFITVSYPSEISVDFTADRTSVTNGETVTFSDRSTGYPDKWTWTFTSDGGKTYTSSEQNPEIIFEEVGIYSVKLVAENPVCKGEKEIKDYITVIDKDAVSADFTAVCRDTYAGGSITFEDKSIGSEPDSWQWTFEGGNPATSTEKSPTVTYSSPGKYKVTMKVTKGDNEDEKTKEGYINVIPSGDLVFFYPFDGTDTDAGPNGINPSLETVGSITTEFNAESRFTGDNAEGHYSARFNGGDASGYSILRVPDEKILEYYDASRDFSVSCWVKTDELPSGKKYAVFHYGAGPGMPNASKQSWFRITTDNKHVVFCIEYSGQSGNWNEYQGEKQYDDGQWHHYVCVYKKNEDGNRDSYLYIDGQVAASSMGKPDKVTETTPFYLGCNYRYNAEGVFSPENFMNGCIDDFVLYNRALTEDEIQNFYNNR